MKMRKSILSLVVSLWVVSLLFAGNAFSEGGAASKSDPNTQQLVINGTCKAMKRISYASNDAIGDATVSAAMVAVPGTSVSFTIPGTVPTCVIVDYSAYTWAEAGELMMVQAVMDGVAVGFPGEVQFDGDSDEDADGAWSRSHNHQWIFQNVAPGPHTVNMQWRSLFGGTVWTHKRTMTVNHK